MARARTSPISMNGMLWLPLFLVLSGLIAMGAALLPMLWAFGVAGWSLATAPEGAAEPVRV